MQNYLGKFCLFFLIWGFNFSQPVYSQKFTGSLIIADSLYQHKEYLKSLVVYETILQNGQEYSPQMLLKMAYMEEALHHYSSSMYYLNLYYNLHPNRAVLKKMEEVAQARGLSGYKYRDIDFFLTQFKKYYMKILELLLVAAVIIVTFMVLKRKQTFFGSNTFRLAFLFYLVLILVYINFLTFRQQGITQNKPAALMDKPAAAAKWLTTFSPGNRLTITGESDIWYEVKWNDKRAYIRKQNLNVLPN